MPRSPWMVLLLTTLVAILVHAGPNQGVPLHSDTTWIFRMIAAPSGAEISSAIPEGLKAVAAYPQPPWSAFLAWYRSTGRFNALDFLAFWGVAKVAGSNADLWRLASLAAMGMALGLFVLVALRLEIAPPVVLLLAISLLFSPLSAWVMYSTSEYKGIFLLMLAFYLTLEGRGRWATVGSAVAMSLAVLIKETFVAAWVLVPPLATYRASGALRGGRSRVVAHVTRQMASHVLPLAAIALFFAVLRAAVDVNASYLIASRGHSAPGQFAAGFLYGLLPKVGGTGSSTIAFWALAAVVVVGVSWYSTRTGKANCRAVAAVANLSRFAVIAALTAAIGLHGALYYVSGRLVTNHYLIPATYEAALLGGILFTGWWRRYVDPLGRGARGRWTIWVTALLTLWIALWRRDPFITLVLVLAAAFVLLAFFRAVRTNGRGYATVLAVIAILVPNVDRALAFAAVNRVDQEAWQGLVMRVAREAPPRAHIILEIKEPLMWETAQSLEANTILLGRPDLTYHLRVQDESFLREDSDTARLSAFLIGKFNEGRAPLPPGRGAALFIRADREGGGRGTPRAPQDLRTQLALLWRSPRGWHWQRYIADRTPYLRYQISLFPRP